MLTDGCGLVAEGTVASVGRDVVEISVRSRRVDPEPQPRLVVVQALAKGDRGETAVETLTEVGVDVVVPWAAERCVTRWKAERGDKALTRWRSTAREAAKQSRRTFWPSVAALAETDDVVRLLASASLGLVLHEEASVSIADLSVPLVGDVVMVIGPEGGVSPKELDAFAGVGAVEVRLGPTVLRTSTAGTVAASVLLAQTPRWT